MERLAAKQKREVDNLASVGTECWPAASSSDQPRAVAADATAAATSAAPNVKAARGKVHIEDWELEGASTPLPKRTGLFPFVLGSLGRPEVAIAAAAGAAAPRSLPVQSPQADDEASISSSDQEMELALDADLEASFENFLKGQAAAEEAFLQPRSWEGPRTPRYSSSLETDELRELLDLAGDGLAVAWPEGLDARVARLVVRARLAGDSSPRQSAAAGNSAGAEEQRSLHDAVRAERGDDGFWRQEPAERSP